MLPGVLRKLGGQMMYQGPRRPVRATVEDCEIRGGEYVAYDRADPATALKIWLSRAESGDGDAQVYVGELYEKGPGSDPDYARAAEWYEKAARAGSAQGKNHLAYLYEQGLGVQRDAARAVNLYREAAGLTTDTLIFQSQVQARVSELSDELKAQTQAVAELSAALDRARTELAAQRTAVVLAQRRVTELRAKLKSLAEQPAAAAQEDAAALRAELARREQALKEQQRQVQSLEEFSAQQAAQLVALRSQLTARQTRLQVQRGEPVTKGEAIGASSTPAEPVGARASGSGTSYALIIANAKYQDRRYAALPSVDNDAAAVDIALQRYGFKGHTWLMKNGTRDQMMNQLAAFARQLGPDDSALIYYSGHGAVVDRNNTTYWLPSDADPDNRASWVSTGWVTEIIGQMRARHVLVVVDSCYAGALVHTTNLRLASRVAEGEAERIRTLGQLPSRTVLTSGGNEPVAGDGPGGGSVFATRFAELLEHNTQVLNASALYDALSDAMSQSNARLVTQGRASTQQLPRYSILANTGHLNGDFLFVPAGIVEAIN